MPSFDVVSQVDMQELDNVINQVKKEIGQRFDFRGSKSSIDLDKTKEVIKINADDDMKLNAMHQILMTKMAKRDVDHRCLVKGDAKPGSMGVLAQSVQVKSGLDKDKAKKVTKCIKDMNIKVTTEIRDKEVRVTSKKIDSLQAVQAHLKSNIADFPVQFVNQRS